MRKRLSAAVAGRRHAHETRIELVLHVTFQDALFDEDVVLSWRAFVVYGKRATAVLDRAIVDDGTKRCFVQQNTGPAMAQHDRHRTGWCRRRVQQHDRLADRLPRQVHGDIVVQEIIQV